MIEKLQEQIYALTAQLTALQKLPRVRLYMAARALVGTDVTPSDKVPDDVACAEVTSTIIRKVTTFPMITGTYTLYSYLRARPNWEKVDKPLPGDIVISPTGTGNGNIRGHVGIMGVGVIYSNNSYTGKLDTHFTLDSWRKRYQVQGGMPVYFFRLI